MDADYIGVIREACALAQRRVTGHSTVTIDDLVSEAWIGLQSKKVPSEKARAWVFSWALRFALDYLTRESYQPATFTDLGLPADLDDTSEEDLLLVVPHSGDTSPIWEKSALESAA